MQIEVRFMAVPAHQDSELQHSFGPGEVTFDYLPLESTTAPNLPVNVQPENRLPVFDLASTGPLELPPALTTNVAPAPAQRQVPRSSAQVKARGAGEIWLEGDVILCACPDCRAPMSIRIWLLIADCWKCGTSIELDEQQEREVQRLLEQRKQEPAAPVPQVPVAQAPVAPAPVVPPAKVEKKSVAPIPPPPAPVSPLAATAEMPDAGGVDVMMQMGPLLPARPPRPTTSPARREEMRDEAAPRQRFKGAVTAEAPAAAAVAPAEQARPKQKRRRVLQKQTSIIKSLFKDTPAWLVSMLIHMVLLTLLGIFSLPIEDEEGPWILLSTSARIERKPGEDVVKIEPQQEEAKFDLPIPVTADINDAQQRQVLIAANQDARDLRLDESQALPLANVEDVKRRINESSGNSGLVAARDPRLRVEVVQQEGGTTLTEAAVARGLRWLAEHQNSDGSWSLRGFKHAADCNCDGDGGFGGKAPGTALAMLPFLGAGQTHQVGKYKSTVSKGLRWMLTHQGEDGDLRDGANGTEGMYTHGQGTIVLCEAFAMTGDEQLRIPAQRAVDFILKAQYNDGGWRYSPTTRSERGDTSVVGWQLMALQSARAANLTVPDQSLGMASLFFDGVQSRDGERYAYMRGQTATPVMTAEALLCRMYLGWNKENPALENGVKWLVENHPPSRSEANIYYWYYATQTMHHYGGEEWEQWNLKMRDILVESQESSGHRAGSWNPRGDHASAGGRIYMTALSVCSLEVYYRHLPIFRQIKLD